MSENNNKLQQFNRNPCNLQQNVKIDIHCSG